MKQTIIAIAIFIALLASGFTIMKVMSDKYETEISTATPAKVIAADISMVTGKVNLTLSVKGERNHYVVSRTYTKYGYWRATTSFSTNNTVYITEDGVIGNIYLGLLSKFNFRKGVL